LSEEYQAMQALILKGAPEALDVGRQMGRPGRQAHSLNPNLLDRSAKLLGELGVGFHQQVLLAAQESVFRVAEIPGYPDHPRLVGIGGATGEVHSSGRDFQDEEQIVSDQPGLGPSLEGSEVNEGQHVPVGFEESLPRGLTFPIRRRLDGVCFQDVADRSAGYGMSKVGQGALDAVIAPRWKMLSSTFFGFSLAVRNTSSTISRGTEGRPEDFRRLL